VILLRRQARQHLAAVDPAGQLQVHQDQRRSHRGKGIKEILARREHRDLIPGGAENALN